MFDTYAVTAIILSAISLVFSCWAMIEVKAMKNSTHKVQFYNADSQEFSAPATEAQRKEMTKDIFDNL